MRGFDLQHNAATKPQQIHTRAHLILKLKPIHDEALLKKVCSIIRISFLSSRLSVQINWSEKYIYVPRDESELENVLGISLLQKGIHPMVVSWSFPMDFEFNMKTLFGTSNDIPLDQLTALAPKYH
jgi:hypothetical protein